MPGMDTRQTQEVNKMPESLVVDRVRDVLYHTELLRRKVTALCTDDVIRESLVEQYLTTLETALALFQHDVCQEEDAPTKTASVGASRRGNLVRERTECPG